MIQTIFLVVPSAFSFLSYRANQNVQENVKNKRECQAGISMLNSQNFFEICSRTHRFFRKFFKKSRCPKYSQGFFGLKQNFFLTERIHESKASSVPASVYCSFAIFVNPNEPSDALKQPTFSSKF